MESEDDMDQDSAVSDKLDSSFSDSSSTGSEEESELDEIESEKWRKECVDKMTELEMQFLKLKEYLFKEKSQQLTSRLELVKLETAQEYLEPVKKFEENLQITLQIADLQLEYRKKNLENKYEAEKQAALQNFESEKINIHDFLYNELLEKIQRLKQDQHSTDISAGLERVITRRKLHKNIGPVDRRRKPVNVSGPFIVYMLPESQILEDYATIKMALKQRLEAGDASLREVSNTMCCRDGRLYYQSDIFLNGDYMSIAARNQPPYPAKILSVGTNEIKFKTDDGSHVLISLQQLQQNKYVLRPL